MTPQLQKPAPDFSGTAVINGQFKEIKLSDFKGKYLVSPTSIATIDNVYSFTTLRLHFQVLFFYPLDL